MWKDIGCGVELFGWSFLNGSFPFDGGNRWWGEGWSWLDLRILEMRPNGVGCCGRRAACCEIRNHVPGSTVNKQPCQYGGSISPPGLHPRSCRLHCRFQPPFRHVSSKKRMASMDNRPKKQPRIVGHPRQRPSKLRESRPEQKPFQVSLSHVGRGAVWAVGAGPSLLLVPGE